MIDALAWKCEDMCSETFKEEFDKIYPNNVFLLFKWRKGLWRDDKFILKNYDNVVWFELRLLLLMLYYCIRYRPRVLYIEHTYLAAGIGWLRKIGWAKKLIYFPGDWLLNKVFPYFDRVACYWSDVVWDTTISLTNCRYQRWGKNVTKKVIHYPQALRNKFTTGFLTANKVLFHGEARKDSGIELARQNKLFEIKIPGYIDRSDFEEQFDDCFCGINLITSNHSWTSNSLPSKVMEYMQFGLPPIVSNNCGAICDTIRKYQLGVVIKPTVANFEMALNRVYYNREAYRNNIEKYIEMISKPTLMEILSD